MNESYWIELLVLESNTWNDLCANKIISESCTLKHLTVCKQMINIK